MPEETDKERRARMARGMIERWKQDHPEDTDLSGLQAELDRQTEETNARLMSLLSPKGTA